MKIDVKTVQEIATLCRLNFDDAQAQESAEQLEKILGYVDQLSQLNTEGVEPLYPAFPLENIWREDQVGESLSKEETFANAPEEEDNYFQVPAVREG